MQRSFPLMLVLTAFAAPVWAQAPVAPTTPAPTPPAPAPSPAPTLPPGPTPPTPTQPPTQPPTPAPPTPTQPPAPAPGSVAPEEATAPRSGVEASSGGSVQGAARADTGHDADSAPGGDVDPAPVPIARGYAPPPPPVALQHEAGSIALIPSGSMFTRYEIRENYEDIGASRGRFLEGDGVAARMRFGFRTSDIDLGDGGHVSVQFTPQASGFWGLMPQQLADADLGLHAGFIHYVPGSAFALDIGRLVLSYGDALVIGDVDWHETGRSFDGARGRFTISDGAWLDVIFTQLSEGRGTSDTDIGAGDTYFGGVYASIGKALGMQADLDPYLLLNLAPATDVVNDMGEVVPRDSAAQGTVGVRLKGDPGVVDYRAEAGLQFGTRSLAPETPVLAYHVDAELGVKVPSAKLRVAVEGFYASGDDPTTEDNEAWDQLFPTAHKWLGLMDVIPARSNIAGGVFHISYAGLQPVTFVGQAHVFASTADVALPADEVLEAGYRGSEIDLGIVVALGGSLKLRTLYGVFLPASEGWADDRAAHYSETELRFDF